MSEIGWGNRSKSGQRLDDKIPAYTASLDAAMALVPDTCLVVLKHLWTKEGKREWYATMNTYKNDMWIDSHDALNPLAAITLCILAVILVFLITRLL